MSTEKQALGTQFTALSSIKNVWLIFVVLDWQYDTDSTGSAVWSVSQVEGYCWLPPIYRRYWVQWNSLVVRACWSTTLGISWQSNSPNGSTPEQDEGSTTCCTQQVMMRINTHSVTPVQHMPRSVNPGLSNWTGYQRGDQAWLYHLPWTRGKSPN